MNRFVIVDGLPYLYADGKTYAVRWDEEGFTVGAEVELAEVPAITYSEISILAKCAGRLNSIDLLEPAAEQDEQPEDDASDEQAEQDEQPENASEELLEKMTVAELKEYAEENGIDLGQATKKADIIRAIMVAE